ncbi:hypothetical protein M422DRAFT_161368 [Sphaerobolus stellatus SS14]|nr:hypothetical protein M422DRAFT_161368 [Sphaerobolus stellatus SS14]
MKLSAAAQSGHAATAFRHCHEMKKAGIRPNLDCYNFLFSACSKQYLWKECLALLEDMERMDISPTVETYNHVLAAQLYNKNADPQMILDAMERNGLQPDGHTFRHIIAIYHMAENLEMCLQTYAELKAYGFTAQLETVRYVVDLAADLGNARLAFELAETYEVDNTSWRKLEAQDWLSVLSVSAASYYVDGLRTAWMKVTRDYGVTPDEGLCIQVLNAAARHGLVDLALEAFKVIIRLGCPIEEFHIAPVLEASCQRKSIQDALHITNTLTTIGAPIRQSTLEPVVELISSSVDNVNKAWSMLEKLYDAGKPVTVHALNALLGASVHLRNLQMTVGIYKTYEKFHVKPTVDTLNLLLRACIAESHKDLGMKFLEDLQRQDDVKLDITSYERIIRLCLTQSDYEDAFFYLEEMKAAGFKPPAMIYVQIIKKCVFYKDTRVQIAVEEMRECGYEIPRSLKEFIENGGSRPSSRVEWGDSFGTGEEQEFTAEEGSLNENQADVRLR